MSYSTSGTTDAGPLTGYVANQCELYSTTAASCTFFDSFQVSGQVATVTSTYQLTDDAGLRWAQVPITAGPASATESVKSCFTPAFSIEGSSSTSTSGAENVPPGATVSAGSTDSEQNVDGSRSTSSGSSLSTGAKAGIGVGAGLGGALFLGIGAFLVVRRNRRNKNGPKQGDLQSDPWPRTCPAAERVPNEMEQPSPWQEKPLNGKAQEMEASHGHSELREQASPVRHELAAGSPLEPSK